MADTSLGEGLGLQSGNRSDYWMRRLADDQRIEDANRRREEEKINDYLKDFKVTPGKYLSMYSKELVNEYAKIYADVAKMRQNNRHVTSGMIQNRILQSVDKINTIEMSNANAMKYINDPNTLKDEAVVGTLMSANSTIKDLPQYNDGTFIITGQQGEFAYKPVSNKPKPTKFDLNTDYVEVQQPNTRVIGNQRIYTVDRKTNPLAIEREAAQLWNDPEFIQQTLFDVRKENLSDEQKVEVVRSRAIQRATQEAPIGFSREERETVPQAPAGSDPSGQKDTPQISYVSDGIMAEIPTYVKGKDGKMQEGEPVKTQVLSYDAAVNIGSVKPVTIPVTAEMIKLNPQLKDVKSINYKPSTLLRARGVNGYELVSLGTVQSATTTEGITYSPDDEDAPAALKKSFEPVVPYNLVKGETEMTYPGKMKGIYDELKIGQKPEKKSGSSTSTYSIKGKNYTEAELIGMGYTPEQIAPYKK